MVDLAFHHAAISVPNLDQAVAWYGEVLGFAVEKTFTIPHAKAQVAMLRRGTLRFEVFELEGASPLPEDRLLPIPDLKTHGNKHVAFRVEDLDAAIAELQSKQVEIVFVVRESFGSGAFFRDCAGNLIELVIEPNP